jgi:hypothetical protein
MVMPCLFDLGAVVLDNAAQHRERARVEAGIVRHVHLRMKPELGVGSILENVDMDGLQRVAFVRLEEEAVAIVAEDYRHSVNHDVRVAVWHGQSPCRRSALWRRRPGAPPDGLI